MGIIRDIVGLVSKIVKSTFYGGYILLKKVALKVKIGHSLYKKRTAQIKRHNELKRPTKYEIY